jgi:hypothetical protein
MLLSFPGFAAPPAGTGNGGPVTGSRDPGEGPRTAAWGPADAPRTTLLRHRENTVFSTMA